MKWFKKNWLQVVNIVLILFVCIYACCFAFNKVKDYEIYKQPPLQTKIYTVWHVETFEGGGKPRIDYIKNIAKTIEKSHSNILFIIKAIKPENLQTELETTTPDIISFGYGVGEIILPHLSVLNSTHSVRDELIESGSFNNKVYALPYIVSGYAEFKHIPNATEFHYGQTGYTKPENICSAPTKRETQYEAYKSFVYNKNAVLFGTARDVFRVNNLNNIGRANATITPINTYSDLIQYVGIITNNDITNLFVEKLLCTTNQSKLVDYSLFSSLYNKIYSSGIYNDMENAILTCKIAKVFNV